MDRRSNDRLNDILTKTLIKENDHGTGKAAVASALSGSTALCSVALSTWWTFRDSQMGVVPSQTAAFLLQRRRDVEWPLSSLHSKIGKHEPVGNNFQEPLSGDEGALAIERVLLADEGEMVFFSWHRSKCTFNCTSDDPLIELVVYSMFIFSCSQSPITWLRPLWVSYREWNLRLGIREHSLDIPRCLP